MIGRVRQLVRPRRQWAATATSRVVHARGIFATRALAEDGEFSDVLFFDTVQPGSELTPAYFANKALLVVNTASQCGYTPQLAGLQELHERFGDKGLCVIAVPSNDFGGQEPGTDKEIQAFYKEKYNVTFPIAKKAAVVGDDAHDFFYRIVTEYSRSVAPTWNFDKFLVDHRGDLRAVFPHGTEPLEDAVIEEIESVLEDLPTPDDETNLEKTPTSFAAMINDPPSSSTPA